MDLHWDRDDHTLSYGVCRDGTLLTTITGSSQYWNRPALTYLDAEADSGSHSYRIEISDKDDNRVWTPTVTVE